MPGIRQYVKGTSLEREDFTCTHCAHTMPQHTFEVIKSSEAKVSEGVRKGLLTVKCPYCKEQFSINYSTIPILQ